jgi:hypothetical protein
MCEGVLHSPKGFLEVGGHLLHFMERCARQEPRLKTNKMGGHLSVNRCSMGGQDEEPMVHHQWIWSCAERFFVLPLHK